MHCELRLDRRHDAAGVCELSREHEHGLQPGSLEHTTLSGVDHRDGQLQQCVRDMHDDGGDQFVRWFNG